MPEIKAAEGAAAPAEEKRRPAYWAVIPAGVRYDPDLPANAKLLFAEISALADSRGYCWASNATLGELYGVSDRTVRRLVETLAERGYLQVEVVRDTQTNAVVERRLWVETPPDKNVRTPPDKIDRTPPDKNVRKNNKENLPSPPISPPQGAALTKGRKTKTAPDWAPERFAGFWKVYPRGEDKQAAIRAWDRLRPDAALIADMGRALLRQIAACEDPKHYMPYASTWLNGRRWEDEDKPEIRPAAQSGGWAPDPEVI